MKRPKCAFASKLRPRAASTTIAVLGFIAVVSMLFTAVLSRAMNTTRQVSHIATWQEALIAADAGGDIALAELRRSLFDINAFSNWERVSPTGTSQGPVLAGTGKTLIKALTGGNGIRYVAPKLTHGGEGNTEMETTVTIDTPPELLDEGGRQWLRVRSTGTTYLPGVARLGGDRRDVRLRQISFLRDPKLDKAVARPQTSRSVEMVVRPIGLEPAIYSREYIDMNNANILVDSYDSRDPKQSLNGLYSSALAGEEGDIATNGVLIDAGGATIKGDAYTNGGKVMDFGGITGEIDNEYSFGVPSILSPGDPAKGDEYWQPGSYSEMTIGGGSTVPAGTKANPARYKSPSLNITGGDLVFAVNPVAAAAGQESYVELWVTGGMKTAGTASIVLQKYTNPTNPTGYKPGVYVKIFVEGDIYIGGGGAWNALSQPARLEVNGVKYTGTGQQPAVTIAGNGIIVASIYAPDSPVEFKATGSGGQMWGSIFGKTIIMGGSTHIHYDRALADVGKITTFRVKSWFEDHRTKTY
jgi:hypothetical protein